jgi:hypothetical protein
VRKALHQFQISRAYGDGFAFEPPSSGPGPVLGKLRRPDGTLILNPVVGDYSNPILRPQASEAVKKSGEMELSGAVPPNPLNQCWPQQTPYTLRIQLGMQLIEQKDEVTLLYLLDSQVRHERMNVPHSAHPMPTWQGESVGHYDGDTLVIDTVGQKVGPLSMSDNFGTPFSAALHVTERYRLIDGALARDLQRKHESTYLGVGRSSPLTNEYGRALSTLTQRSRDCRWRSLSTIRQLSQEGAGAVVAVQSPPSGTGSPPK